MENKTETAASMDCRLRKAIRSNYEFVVKNLDVRPTLDRLISREALSHEEVEYIRLGDTTAEKARRLLDKVISTDRPGFIQDFLDALPHRDAYIHKRIGATFTIDKRRAFSIKKGQALDGYDPKDPEIEKENEKENEQEKEEEKVEEKVEETEGKDKKYSVSEEHRKTEVSENGLSDKDISPSRRKSLSKVDQPLEKPCYTKNITGESCDDQSRECKSGEEHSCEHNAASPADCGGCDQKLMDKDKILNTAGGDLKIGVRVQVVSVAEHSDVGTCDQGRRSAREMSYHPALSLCGSCACGDQKLISRMDSEKILNTSGGDLKIERVVSAAEHSDVGTWDHGGRSPQELSYHPAPTEGRVNGSRGPAGVQLRRQAGLGRRTTIHSDVSKTYRVPVPRFLSESSESSDRDTRREFAETQRAPASSPSSGREPTEDSDSWTKDNCPELCTRYIILSTSAATFSFQINPRREPGSPAFLVSHVTPGGVAEREGDLQHNDQITSINGRRCDVMTHADAMKTMLHSGQQLVLGVTSRGRIETEKITVKLDRKAEDGGWGLKFVSGKERPRFAGDDFYYVNGLVEGSVSARSGLLQVGDTLLRCNGVELRTAETSDIEGLMRNTPFMTLVVERRRFIRSQHDQ